MSLISKYTPEQVKMMDMRSFLQESVFDDIYSPLRLLRIARYARESTNHEEQRNALENQVSRLDKFIEENCNYIIEEKHRYTEYGISGRTVEDRTAFNLMIEAAKRHEFDVLIVQDICRFARNLRELLNYIEILKVSSVGLLILDGRYWTFNMNETDLLRLALEGGMAQGESMRTSKRVGNGIQSYRDRGQLVVSEVFGYELIKAVDRRENTLKIHPENALTVKKIFDLYAHPDTQKRIGTSKIADYLNSNGYKTARGDLNWSASKVNRVLKNEKYMGYILYGKFKVPDVMTKKKIATHIKPIRENQYDEEGSILVKCNLVQGKWEPIVSEDVWWLADSIRNKRAAFYTYSNKGNLRNGLRESKDIIATKSFCQCGYSRSPQYVHVATEDREAQFRYTCRGQLNAKTPEYRKKNNLPEVGNKCEVEAVSEVKLWLMSLKVFEYVFGNSKQEILLTLKLLKESQQYKIGGKGSESLSSLQAEKEAIERQIENLYIDKLDGVIDNNMWKKVSQRLEDKKNSLERGIMDRQQEEARDSRKNLDLEIIEKQLDTYVDFTGRRVSNELIDMFVERIIYRANDEFVWEMNLSGVRSDANGYRIKEYSEEYAKELQSDENFHIIHSFLISAEECKKFMESEKVNRRFVKKYWRPITVKIAVK